MQDSMVTTALTLPGYKIVRNIGVVRGITVRSRSIVGNFSGGLQSIFGGNIKVIDYYYPTGKPNHEQPWLAIVLIMPPARQ